MSFEYTQLDPQEIGELSLHILLLETKRSSSLTDPGFPDISQSGCNPSYKGGACVTLLRTRGPDEEQLRMLLTLPSLIIARLALYTAHCVMVLALVAAFSFGVASEVKTSDVRSK